MNNRERRTNDEKAALFCCVYFYNKGKISLENDSLNIGYSLGEYGE